MSEAQTFACISVSSVLFYIILLHLHVLGVDNVLCPQVLASSSFGCSATSGVSFSTSYSLQWSEFLLGMCFAFSAVALYSTCMQMHLCVFAHINTLLLLFSHAHQKLNEAKYFRLLHFHFSFFFLFAKLYANFSVLSLTWRLILDSFVLHFGIAYVIAAAILKQKQQRERLFHS